MAFKGINLLGEEVFLDECGGRLVRVDGEVVASISSTQPFDPFSEFALVNDRFVTVLEMVERVCRANEGRGIAAIGVNAALREMSKYWESHLIEGHGHKIVLSDLRDAQSNLLEAMAELATMFAAGARPKPIAYCFAVAEYAVPGQETVSDIRLAAKLQHTKRHSCTVLLTVDVEGREYALQLAGYIGGFDHQKNDSIDYSLSDDLIAALEKPLDERPDEVQRLEMDSGPWFEWVASDGSPVGDVMDSISLDPNQEISKLKALLLSRS